MWLGCGFPGTGTRTAWGAWGPGGVETGNRQSLHRPRLPTSRSPRSARKGSGEVLPVQGPHVAPPTLEASSPPPGGHGLLPQSLGPQADYWPRGTGTGELTAALTSLPGLFFLKKHFTLDKKLYAQYLWTF